MKSENEVNENYEINQLNNLEGYENTNAELTTITNIQDLNNNKDKYQKIILSHNKLTQVKEFYIFTNLVYLDLSFNQIDNIKKFPPLDNLEILMLANNFINEISTYLFPLQKLQHLDLSNNHLDMKNDMIISSLKKNIELKSLLLCGNYNYDFEKIKYSCLDNLTKLIHLDTIKIVNNKENTKNKKKKIQKAYINVKGIKGNQKKVSTLNEYIKFKIDDFNNNKKDYENNIKENEKKNDDNMKELNKESKSSYYYLNFPSSL